MEMFQLLKKQRKFEDNYDKIAKIVKEKQMRIMGFILYYKRLELIKSPHNHLKTPL